MGGDGGNLNIKENHLQKELDCTFEMGICHKWRTIQDSDRAAFILNYGVILKDKYRKRDEAKKWFIWALNVNLCPDDSTVFTNLVELCIEMEQLEEAQKYQKMKEEYDRKQRSTRRK